MPDKFDFCAHVSEIFNSCKDEKEVTKKYIYMKRMLDEAYTLHFQYAKLGILERQLKEEDE